MRAHSLLVLSIVVAALAAACRSPGPRQESDVLVNDALTVDIDLAPLSDETLAVLCKGHRLVVFIGNAEPMGKLYVAKTAEKPLTPAQIDTITRSLAERDAVIATATKRQIAKIIEGFSRPGICRQRGLDQGASVFLATVYDGPGGKDSEIRTVVLSGEGSSWKEVERREWTYKEGTLAEASTGNAAFELNMPKDLNGLLKAFKSRAEARRGGAKIDGTMFFFKGHGGFQLPPPNAIGGVSATQIDLLQLPQASSILGNHRLMFDTHGSDGEDLTASGGAFAPLWSLERACAIQAAAGRSDVVEGCSAAHGATSGSPDGAATSGSPDGPATSGTPDGATTSGSPDGPATSGTPDGATTSGSPDGPATSGTPDGATTSGSPDGPATSGSPDGAATSGIGGAVVSGLNGRGLVSGKGSLVPGGPDAIEVYAKKPNGLQAGLLMGTSLTGDFRGIDFPQGDRPTFFLLDSCYSNVALNLDSILTQPSQQNPDLRPSAYTAFFSAGPIYANLLQYDRLDSSQLLALGLLSYWREVVADYGVSLMAKMTRSLGVKCATAADQIACATPGLPRPPTAEQLTFWKERLAYYRHLLCENDVCDDWTGMRTVQFSLVGLILKMEPDYKPNDGNHLSAAFYKWIYDGYNHSDQIIEQTEPFVYDYVPKTLIDVDHDRAEAIAEALEKRFKDGLTLPAKGTPDYIDQGVEDPRLKAFYPLVIKRQAHW